jgi:hypothetical protein
MTRILGIVCGILTLLLFVDGPAIAGAKSGKMRWTSNNNNPNAKEALKIPAANGNTPGILELKIAFKGGELAEFSVIGDGDTDLDLLILDTQGKIVAQDIDPPASKGGGSDICMCRWTPNVEQIYTIRIVNYGRVYNIAQAACN